MAASRSMLEALLLRVQQRAGEPRGAAQAEAQPPSLSSAELSPSEAAAVEAEDARTLPPPGDELADEDIEEYDDELIEIIDDAEVIQQAAAAARAIDGRALVSSLERRSNASALAVKAAPASAPASKPATAPASVRSAVSRPAAPANDALRPESVSPRPVVAAEVAKVHGGRRELRASSFVELLDASLKLGS
jgi:hypothetical protein